MTVEGEIQPEVVVWADELLAAVFENLLSNAVKHNDSDKPHIVVSVDEGDHSATVSIADNGPGVPDDRKGSIFDPGAQGEGSIGQGLGLYLVDTLVDRYGGTVQLEDNDPRGTVAVVELPYPTS